jgi:ADP-dependent NAD(P)H-hydrate dehydratase / NAD(P)H-hydrate epimerase
MTIAEVTLFDVASIRAIESEFVRCSPGVSLMQRAGDAAARLVEDLLAGAGGRVLVLAGPGNNGGDAWVAARALQKSWYRVTVLSGTSQSSLARAATDARENFVSSGGRLVSEWADDENYDLIVDGLLGIGIARAVGGDLATLIARTNQCGIPILALDLPSGLCADTGVALGETIRAQHTITFIGAKPGLYTADGRDHCGEVHLEALGIDPSLLRSPNRLLQLNTLRHLIPRRAHNSHKGSYGSLGLLGSAAGMTGAGTLAARAALLLGTGRVFLAALAEDAPAYDSAYPEIMLRKPKDLLAREALSALVVGPGMGTSDGAKNLLAAALKHAAPLVLDADALTLIADGRALQNALVRRTAATLLTPHPGEAARLLQCDIAEVQRDRIKAATRLSKRFNQAVVLKGSGSVVAFPDGLWHINGTGNPGMASAGMGDVLSGMLGALLAQGVTPANALMLGVTLHGAAADALANRGVGPNGLTASEVAFEARALLNASA